MYSNRFCHDYLLQILMNAKRTCVTTESYVITQWAVIPVLVETVTSLCLMACLAQMWMSVLRIMVDVNMSASMIEEGESFRNFDF